jgi:hypothetical protein
MNLYFTSSVTIPECFFCLVPFQFLTCLSCRQEWDGWAYPFSSFDSSQSNSEVNLFIIDTAGKLANLFN